jgi:hypothetical protein
MTWLSVMRRIGYLRSSSFSAITALAVFRINVVEEGGGGIGRTYVHLTKGGEDKDMNKAPLRARTIYVHKGKPCICRDLQSAAHNHRHGDRGNLEECALRICIKIENKDVLHLKI